MADNYIFDLDEGVTRTPVAYKNRYGIAIAADVYRPAANHIDLYDRTDLIPSDRLEEFFTEHLVRQPDLALAGASVES